MSLEFFLATEDVQRSNPKERHGGDLDNLVKIVFDAMRKTVLTTGDGAILEVRASKRRARDGKTGVRVRVTGADPSHYGFEIGAPL